jgi:hypothetical protein
MRDGHLGGDGWWCRLRVQIFKRRALLSCPPSPWPLSTWSTSLCSLVVQAVSSAWSHPPFVVLRVDSGDCPVVFDSGDCPVVFDSGACRVSDADALCTRRRPVGQPPRRRYASIRCSDVSVLTHQGVVLLNSYSIRSAERGITIVYGRDCVVMSACSEGTSEMRL